VCALSDRKSMKKEQERAISLIFHRDQILYDCETGAYVEGDVMSVEDEHAKHQVMDIAQEGNVDRVTRVLNTAFNECVEMCYPFAKTKTLKDGDVLDDTLQAPGTYVLTLRVPCTLSDTTIHLLRDKIHERLVCSVMADWMSITKPNVEGNWEKKVEAANDSIKTCLHGRMRRVRRRMTPF